MKVYFSLHACMFAFASSITFRASPPLIKFLFHFFTLSVYFLLHPILKILLLHSLLFVPLSLSLALCPDHLVSIGECHRDHGVHQWEDSNHDKPISSWLEPSHQPAVNAAQRHCGPSSHGWLCQVRKGKQPNNPPHSTSSQTHFSLPVNDNCTID